MTESLNAEQQAVVDAFARFTDEQIVPKAEQIDLAHAFPREQFQALAELGLFGMRYPVEDGGSGLDFTSFCLALMEIARGSMSVAACVTMQSLMGTHFLHALGGPEIRERLFLPALRGEKVGAICMTEPNAGSDLDSIATHAEKVPGGYRLSGQKTWVTSAPVADFFTVFARVGPEKLLSIFLVERDCAGVVIGRPIEKMGVWALPTSEVAFEGCLLSEASCLSRQHGDGEAHLRGLLSDIRIVTAATAVGCGRAALAAAVRYSGERKQFGKPIGRFQAIQLKLAEMAIGLAAAERMVLHAASLKQDGKPCRLEAAMAKVFASEAAAEVCDQAARIFASYGYAMEYPVQRYLRDIRFTLIGGGTSEILKLVIAKELTS